MIKLNNIFFLFKKSLNISYLYIYFIYLYYICYFRFISFAYIFLYFLQFFYLFLLIYLFIYLFIYLYIFYFKKNSIASRILEIYTCLVLLKLTFPFMRKEKLKKGFFYSYFLIELHIYLS